MLHASQQEALLHTVARLQMLHILLGRPGSMWESNGDLQAAMQ